MENETTTTQETQPAPALSTEAAARTHLLSRQIQKPVHFKEVLFDGRRLAIRKPTVGERDYILAQSAAADASGVMRVMSTRKRVAALISCVCALGEDGKLGPNVFGVADFADILKMQSSPGDMVSTLGAAAVDFMDEPEPSGTTKEAAAKNV